MAIENSVSTQTDLLVADYVNNNKECIVGQPKVPYCIKTEFDSSYNSSLNLPSDWHYDTSELGKTNENGEYDFNSTIQDPNNTPDNNDLSNVNFTTNTNTTPTNAPLTETWWSQLKDKANSGNDDNNDGNPDTPGELISTGNGVYTGTDNTYTIDNYDDPKECPATCSEGIVTLPNSKAGGSYAVRVNASFDNLQRDEKVMICAQYEDGSACVEVGDDFELQTVFNDGTMSMSGGVLGIENEDGTISGAIFLTINLTASVSSQTFQISARNATIDCDNITYTGDCEPDKKDYQNTDGLGSTSDSSSYDDFSSTCVLVDEYYYGEVKTFSGDGKQYALNGASISLKNVVKEISLSYSVGSFYTVDDASGTHDWDKDYMQITNSIGTAIVAVTNVPRDYEEGQAGYIYENTTGLKIELVSSSKFTEVLDGQKDENQEYGSSVFTFKLSGIRSDDTISISFNTDESFEGEAIGYKIGSATIDGQCFFKATGKGE